MAIPPFVNTRLNKGEKLDQGKAEEIFDAMTRNFEDLYNRYQTVEAQNEALNGFLRLVVSGKHKVNFGTTTVKWGSKNIASSGKVITHKLGETPTFALAGGLFAGNYGEVNALGKTQFEIRLVSTTGEIEVNTERTAFWIAAF